MKSILTPDEFKLSNLVEVTGSDTLWPVYIELSNEKCYGADIIINATGVQSQLSFTVTSPDLVSVENISVLKIFFSGYNCSFVFILSVYFLFYLTA